MNIVVLDGHTLNPGDNPWSALEALGTVTVYPRTRPDELVERAREADILLTNKTSLPKDVLAQLPRLKFIAVLATGFNCIDVTAARARNVPVANVPSYGTESVAQHVFALLLELTQGCGEHAQAVAAGEWAACPDFSFWRRPLVELRGLRLGIVGFGRIGRRVAEIGHAFGMKILAAARFQPGGKRTERPDIVLADNALGAWPIPVRRLSIERLFSEADVVSLHCPQTNDNAGFVDRQLLRRMKPSAYLINTARGTLIQEADLQEALQQGWIAGAALDVLATEPPPPGHGLMSAPRCLVTPHLAWATGAARRRLMQTVVANVSAFLGGRPQNVVN